MSILAKIIAHKKTEVQENKAQAWSTEEVRQAYIETLAKSEISFYKALKNSEKKWPRLIAEVKKGSPSKGIIRENFDVEEIVKLYDEYADAMSILTDEKFFLGSLENLKIARKHTDKPLLRKDFIIDEFQIYEARKVGANAVLLLASVLDVETMREFLKITHSLGMDALVEVHDEEELKNVLKTEAKIIGINNRNLKDFSIDLENSNRLAALIPEDKIVISESGIDSMTDIRKVKAKADAILVGTAITGTSKMEPKIRKITGLPEIKICGITNCSDAQAAVDYGADYLGFIFHEKSPRSVTVEECESIVEELKACQTPLRGQGGVAAQFVRNSCNKGQNVSVQVTNTEPAKNTSQPPSFFAKATQDTQGGLKSKTPNSKLSTLNSTKLVGVFVNKNIDQVLEIARRCQLDVIQLHGEETNSEIKNFKLKIINELQATSDSIPLEGDIGGVQPQAKQTVTTDRNTNTPQPPQGGLATESPNSKLSTLNSKKLQTLNSPEVWKAIRIKDKEDLKQIEDYPDADGILLDTYSEKAYGGTGESFDWKILENFKPTQKLILAGGLDATNMKQAIEEVHPDVLDFASKLEAKPGKKDLEKLGAVFKLD